MKSTISPKAKTQDFKYPGLQVHLPTGAIVLFDDNPITYPRGTLVWKPDGTAFSLGESWLRTEPENYAPFNGKVTLEN